MRKLLSTSVATAVCLCAAPLFAQVQRAPAQPRVRVEANRPISGELDSKTRGSIVRASQLTGQNIENSQGESVGEVHDVVLDVNTGKVRYVAVTYGGFLGLGDKLFAVPFEAFTCKVDPDNPDNHILILDVTQQQLDGAEGFDQDHWPNFGDTQYTAELDTRYRVNRTARDDRGAGVDVDIDRTRRNRRGVDVDVDRNRPNRRGAGIDVDAGPVDVEVDRK